jgi:four helix bundle protein
MTNNEGMTKSEARNARAEDSFWQDGAAVVREEPETKRVYDLEERTARFGEAIIDFAKTIPENPLNNRIITQLVGAATSVGANHVEADDAVSKKEFLKCVGTCRKETRETKHFLRMIVRAVPELKPQTRTLWIEAKELHLIFSKIWKQEKGLTAMRLPKVRKARCVRHSGFIIISSFDIRISSFSSI